LFFHLQKDHLEEVGWAVMRGKQLKARIVVGSDGPSNSEHRSDAPSEEKR
jgi:hypothetical protein